MPLIKEKLSINHKDIFDENVRLHYAKKQKINFVKELENLPYKYIDPHNFDKKVDPKNFNLDLSWIRMEAREKNIFL
ncbi:MAG: hypothetical protein M5T52_08560 [Ignavibacteriaceae bacterium]|nr:hypothetical protein [Ignavibacteriaceae bacterium]